METQAARSAELQDLVRADQAERQGAPESIDWAKVGPRDLRRRMRVGEIFGEGCFRDARDFAAAALVYQHGDTSDHVYQTFIWARRAVELGDSSQRRLMVMGLDRYLVRIGRKQLFATQGGKDAGSDCWCLEPVEATFPDSRRIAEAGKSLDDALAWVRSLNEGHPACADSRYCPHPLNASPVGTVPGFW